METPLSPLEFFRRARRLYPDREAVVDENLRLTYIEFGKRCDRWSATLQQLGVAKGDRVAYIAPNTHAQLESFYAIPQIGAVLVPINYRLIADDFAYIIQHSGATVVCVHSDYLEVVERMRPELPGVKHFVALEGLTETLRETGWLDYDPDATALAFDGGWFHTGDAAVVHPDGYVEIRDRIKDVIISGGENISSVEVEALLLRHPAVQEVAVVGIPDKQWGEVPHAYVVLQAGQNVSEEELRTFLRERMAHFKVPRSYTFVVELPKTATGKIQKYVLRSDRSAIAAQ